MTTVWLSIHSTDILVPLCIRNCVWALEISQWTKQEGSLPLWRWRSSQVRWPVNKQAGKINGMTTNEIQSERVGHSILNSVRSPHSHRNLFGLKIQRKHISKHIKIPNLLENLYNLVLENNYQSPKWISVFLQEKINKFHYIKILSTTYIKRPHQQLQSKWWTRKIFATCTKQGQYP